MGAGTSACAGECFSWARTNPSASKTAQQIVADRPVVIVGAGLAGLACAMRLQEKGVACVVVEARKGVGGRASRGGADFVHGENVTTWKYMERFGMKADPSLNGWAEAESTHPGECWVYTDGELRGHDRVHSEPNRLFFGKFDDATEEWINAGGAEVSLAHLIDKVFDQPPTADERRLMEGAMAEWHAADLADISVYEDDLYSDRIKKLAESRPCILSEDGDEGHWRIIGGHQGLAENMAKGLDVHLETIVEKVSWSGQGVHVECKGSKVFTGRAAVVTLPLACIPDVEFIPALPTEKQQAAQKLGRGVTTTVYLRFRERFWPEKMAFLFHPFSSQCCWPGRGRNVLTAYFGGATANSQLLCLSDQAMTDEILSQLATIFSKSTAEVSGLLINSEVHRWDTDVFAKMSYSYCPVGAADLRTVLGAPTGNLFWAGEATHPTKGSFAHGALEEGERAAEEVLAFVQRSA